ncbi:MAG: ATP-dependent helicase HrpB [Sediminibacterium sp.]|nr:ATP-dependent helicase HrpB [Sediminibacterium sp.]
MFDPTAYPLPVRDCIPDLKHHLSRSATALLGAPPGAGKSTLLPLALLDAAWLEGKKIIMLEPRRLAAKSIAGRMAQMLGEPVGETVGYRIRLETRIGKNTRLEVVTEGILTRMLQSDNALEAYGLVIFDEFHERSLQADMALALCREAQQVLRPELRILIMSATLNMPDLQALLNAPVIESSGRQFPVDVFYGNDADESLLPELTAQKIAEAVQQHEGDVLAFLPGEADIRRCEALLKNDFPEFRVHPLYGMLPPGVQQAAILPDKNGVRKIVLATSIAETSLTIEGIRIVVDCGFSKRQRFDTRSGLSKLETLRITKDAADQRAGRAGRLSSGVCYRLWSPATQSRLAEHRVPEILEADLCPLVLEMAKWGVSDIYSLNWLNPPPKTSIRQSYDLLEQLGALKEQKLTPHGQDMHRLGCHPRIAHMLLLAKDETMKQLGCDIAALLEERDPMSRESGIDITLRVETLRRARSLNRLTGAWKRIAANAANYLQLLQLQEGNGPVVSHSCGLLLAYAYPERIASARPGNNARFQLANGKYAMFSHQDDLAHEPWLAVAHMDLREGDGKIFLAAALDPTDLQSLLREEESLYWDTRKGGLQAFTEWKLGALVLQRKALTRIPEALISGAIAKAIATEGLSLLNWDETMEQMQARIASVKIWYTDQLWPDTDTDYLLQNAENWLGPYLSTCRKPDDLKKLNLSDCLLHSLSWEQQQALNTLVPDKLEVPSGSKLPIRYFMNGATPVMAVRLQEVFGLADTPKVNSGRMAIVLHLLSPGYKPVQVTSDLKSFWDNLYHDVKKELQRRYPKHAWPDDPWSAKAVAKGKSVK